jgi:Bacterial TSP3 repeat
MFKWLALLMAVFAYLAATVSAAPRDRDHDRLPDRWERNHGLSPRKASAKRDPDSDHLRNLREFRLRTHPRRADTDRDGLRDGAEVRRFRTNPRKRDTDGDRFSDRCELRKGTNPRKRRSRPKRRCSKSPKSPQPPTPQPSQSCTGYPEPRVYLEGQSWWEPQTGPASHPGTGKQGHIHLETCFPLYKHYTGSEKIRFDYTIRLHNMPGQLVYLHQSLYGEDGTKTLNGFGNEPVRCPTADCVYRKTLTLDLSGAKYSGLHVVSPGAQVFNEPGLDGEKHTQMAIPYWPIYLDNGKPPPPPGSDAAVWAGHANQRGLIGDTYYPLSPDGDYSQVAIARADLPYVEGSLAPKVISGVWRPRVFFEKDTAFAYVDPMLHATPRDEGVVFLEQNIAGNAFRKVAIDTTRLADGEHRLLVGSCNVNIAVGGTVNGQVQRGDNCGTLVVRFMVDNTSQSAARAARAFDMPGVGPCLLGDHAAFASRAGPSASP